MEAIATRLEAIVSSFVFFMDDLDDLLEDLWLMSTHHGDNAAGHGMTFDL